MKVVFSSQALHGAAVNAGITVLNECGVDPGGWTLRNLYREVELVRYIYEVYCGNACSQSYRPEMQLSPNENFITTYNYIHKLQ
jgi:hypothetical protein